jgi:hypothetical protein
MSYSRLTRNLKRTPLFWLAVLAVILVQWSSDSTLNAQRRDRATNGVTAATGQGENAQDLREFWTAERMATARPMEKFVDADEGMQVTGTQALAAGATPRLVAGYDPARAAAKALAGLAQTLIAQPMTSPPFVPPATPTSYSDYAPFQRYTHFGNYFTYPISTVGVLYFVIPGQGTFRCSASAINRNTLATAGHCVYSPGIGFHSNFIFCPSYVGPGTPPGPECIRGSWGWTGFAATSTAWTLNQIDRDFACVVTNAGNEGQGALGNITGWLGRAFNWPSRQAEFAWGYPAGPPFNGNLIQTVTSTEWYQVNMSPGDGPGVDHLSKYIGSDMTGGSSGGPWWLSHRHPNIAIEVPDTDGQDTTDPGQGGGPFINGVNSHKRCAGNCNNPPAGGLFWQEMGSPQFLSTAAGGESEDVFAQCFAAGGQ